MRLRLHERQRQSSITGVFVGEDLARLGVGNSDSLLVVHGQRLHFGNFPHIPSIVKAATAMENFLATNNGARNLTRFEKVLEI